MVKNHPFLNYYRSNIIPCLLDIAQIVLSNVKSKLFPGY